MDDNILNELTLAHHAQENSTWMIFPLICSKLQQSALQEASACLC